MSPVSSAESHDVSSGLHKPYSVGRPACVLAHVSNVFDHSVSCRPSWSEVTDPHFVLVSQGTVFRFCSRQWGTVTMMASTEDPKFNLKPEQPWGIFTLQQAWKGKLQGKNHDKAG